MQTVLQKLKEIGLYININKCEFYIKEVLYLEMIIGRYSIKINPAKVTAIKDWLKPENIKNI